MAKKPHSNTRMESCQRGMKSSVGGSFSSFTASKKKGSHGG